VDPPENTPSDADEAPRSVLVSACLLGRTCRYDGRHNADAVLRDELAARGEVAVPFCPEEAGGLATPRPPAWLTGSAAEVVDGEARVVTDAGADVTDAFLAGARGALERAREVGATRAFLKERSPSCGCRATHVDGELVDGPGVTAEVLRRAGIAIEGIQGRRA
jgi:uncharacterized protein YbbK (DUF523 family)